MFVKPSEFAEGQAFKHSATVERVLLHLETWPDACLAAFPTLDRTEDEIVYKLETASENTVKFFTASENDKLFSTFQPCQLVKNNRLFSDQLSPHDEVLT
jgi:hypothetical protein